MANLYHGGSASLPMIDWQHLIQLLPRWAERSTAMNNEQAGAIDTLTDIAIAKKNKLTIENDVKAETRRLRRNQLAKDRRAAKKNKKDAKAEALRLQKGDILGVGKPASINENARKYRVAKKYLLENPVATKVVEPVVEAVANPMETFSIERKEWLPGNERQQDYRLKMTFKEIFAMNFEFDNGYKYMKLAPQFPGAFQLNARNKEISVQAGRAIALLLGGLWKVMYSYEGVKAPVGSYILRNEAENRLIVVYTEQDEEGRGAIARVQEFHFADKEIQDADHKHLEPIVGWSNHSIENRVRRATLDNNRRNGSKTWVCALTKYHILAKMLMAKEQERAVETYKNIFGDNQEEATKQLDIVRASGDKKAIDTAETLLRLADEATGIRLVGWDKDGLQHGLSSELWIVCGNMWEEYTRARRMYS